MSKQKVRQELPPTEVYLAEDGTVISFQDYMDFNLIIVPGMHICKKGNDWTVLQIDPEHGGGLHGKGSTLKEALQNSGLHESLHKHYLKLFALVRPSRSDVARILGGKAGGYKIIKAKT